MKDIKGYIIKGLWNFITDNELEVVDTGEDLNICFEPMDIEELCEVYIQDFEYGIPATIRKDGSVFIEASKILNKDGITVQQFKEYMPCGFSV